MTAEERARMEYLVAKAYFEWGLSPQESDELDDLFEKARGQLAEIAEGGQ